MARFVLITGRTGSGKSKVSELLRNKHYIVVDGDEFAKTYYSHPWVYKELIEKFGVSVLDNKGAINKSFISKMYLKNGKEKNSIAETIIPRMLGGLLDKYNSSNEVIFLECALIREIGYVCSELNINKIIMVEATHEKRMERIKTRKNANIHTKLESFQHEKFLYEINLGEECEGDNKDIDIYKISNNGSVAELNDKLMLLLQNDLDMTHNEQLATYLRYLKESPNYCHNNAWCYSFYNNGGCNLCPFPCTQQDKNFEKLNKQFRKEKGL